MKAPWHHLRTHKQSPKFLASPGMARFIDKMIFFVAIATPLMTIPQVWEIWVNKTVRGVSVATWIGYLLASVCWLMYGTLHRDKPIIYTQTLWIIFSAMVVAGLVAYS